MHPDSQAIRSRRFLRSDGAFRMKARTASPVPGSHAGRACVTALLAGALTVACASDPWELRGSPGGELAVYEATTRYVVRHYNPSADVEGRLAAVCLVVGRRARVPLRQQERGVEWNPPGGLLGRLEDLPHPVVPVSQCSWDRHLREIHRPTGGRALVLALSHPIWESRATAYVRVESRESEGHRFRYGCELSWKVDRWTVDHCLRPDRRRRGR